MKKIISMFLMIGIISSMSAFAVASGGNMSNFKNVNDYSSATFNDVPANAWYYKNVKKAYEMGLIYGTSSTTFEPSNNITIASSIALACRLHSIYNTGKSDFIQGTPWYQVYVDYALKNHIISSYDFKDYSLEATRAQFVQIFANALPKNALTAINSVKSGDIPDVKENASYSEAVYSLYNAGILTGSDKQGTFYPDSNISRSEVAAIVTRMADKNLRVKIDKFDSPAQNSDNITAKDQIIYEDGYVRIRYQEIYQQEYLPEMVYISTIIENKTNQVINVIPMDSSVNDTMTLFMSSSSKINAGKKLNANYFFTYENAGITSLNDVNTFSFYLSVNGDSYNEIYRSDEIVVRVK